MQGEVYVSQEDSDFLVLAGVGDVSPQRDDPPSIFQHCREALRKADIVFGQMEANISDRGTPMFVNSGWPIWPPGM
jgi:hypothetical protein